MFSQRYNQGGGGGKLNVLLKRSSSPDSSCGYYPQNRLSFYICTIYRPRPRIQASVKTTTISRKISKNFAFLEKRKDFRKLSLKRNTKKILNISRKTKKIRKFSFTQKRKFYFVQNFNRHYFALIRKRT